MVNATYRTYPLMPSGGHGTCQECGHRVPCRLPRARFHPGDGSSVLAFAHYVDGRKCPGSGEESKESMTQWHDRY